MGSKSPTTQTSSTTTADPTAAADITSSINRARRASNTPYQAYTGELTAGVNSQEQNAISATNGLAGATNGYLGSSAGLAAASTAAVNPTAINGSTIAQYESPYQSDVINATMAEINNQNAQQRQGQTSAAISAGAFGGDRAGVAQAALANQQDLASNATLANLNNQNYAQALGEANTQQQTTLSADQANRAALQSGSELYSGLGGLASSTGIANAQAQLEGGLVQQQTQQASDTAKYGQFENQQAYPFQTAQFLAGITGSLAPSLGTSTSGTTVSSAPNVLNSILGGALGIGSFYLPKAKGGAVLDLGSVGRARGGRTVGDLRDDDDLTYQGLGRARRFATGGMAGVPYSDATGYVPAVGLAAARMPSPGMSMPQPSQQGAADPSMANLSTGLAMAGKNFMNSNAGDAVNDFAQDNLGLARGGKVLDLGSVRTRRSDRDNLGHATTGLARARRGYDGGGVVSDPNAMLFDPAALGDPSTLAGIQPGLGAAPMPDSITPPAAPAAPAPPPSPPQGLAAAAPSSPPAGLAAANSSAPVPVAPAPTVTPVIGYRGADGTVAPAPASPAGVAAADTSSSSAATGGLGAIDKAAPGSGQVGSNFDRSVNRTFQFEGGYNPNDANGSPTNFGINQASHPDIDVSKLTPDQAKGIYKSQYWDAIGADNLPPALAHVAFDTAVVAGPAKAKEFISQSGGDPNKFMDLRDGYLNGLVASDPQKYGAYAKTWADRDAALRADIGGATPSSAMAYAGGDGGSGGSASAPDISGSAPGVLAAVKSGVDTARSGVGGLLDAIVPSGLHFTDQQRMGVLAAGLGMMASPSRSVGQAIGQGGLQGVEAYAQQQKIANDQRTIALRSQELQANLLRIAQEGKNYESEAQYRKAEGSARQQDATATTNRVNLERYQLIPGPDGDFRYFDKLNPGAGLMTSAQIGGALGASHPGGPNGSGSSVSAPMPSSPGAPSGPPAPTAPTASNVGQRPATASGPMQLDSSNFTRTGNPTLRAPQGYLPTGYYQNQLRAQNDPVVRDTMAKQTVGDVTEANSRATKAYSGMFYSDQMDKAIAGLPQTGVLAPGGFFNERLNIAKNWNAFASAIPGMGDMQVNADAVAKGESLIKDKTRLAADLTQSLGSREAAAVYSSMMSAVPGGDNSRQGYKAVSSAIRSLSQREIDHNAFMQDYVSRYGNTNGAEVAFNQLNPAMVYAQQAASLARIPQQASDLLRANSNDPRTIAAFESKYGAGTARYFTGQVAQ